MTQPSELEDRTPAPPAVLLELHGTVALITLNEPDKRNAFSAPLRRQLTEHLDHIVHDPGIRACVIAASGPSFCGGGDISGMVKGGFLDYRQRMRGYHDIVRAIVDGPKPVIAAVQGPAYGAGFSLAMACDQVVVTPQARFCSAFARLNLLPDMGLLHTLVRRVGPWAARRMMMTSEVLDADTALRLGVVDQVVEANQLSATAMGLAAAYAELTPDAFALLKSVFSTGAIHSLDEVLRLETEMQAVLRTTPGHEVAVRDFLSSRSGARARPTNGLKPA